MKLREMTIIINGDKRETNERKRASKGDWGERERVRETEDDG